MDRKKKRVAAISAAIAKYMEEEASVLQMTMQEDLQKTVMKLHVAVNRFSKWALSGRLWAMERRYNLQYRMNR